MFMDISITYFITSCTDHAVTFNDQQNIGNCYILLRMKGDKTRLREKLKGKLYKWKPGISDMRRTATGSKFYSLSFSLNYKEIHNAVAVTC